MVAALTSRAERAATIVVASVPLLVVLAIFVLRAPTSDLQEDLVRRANTLAAFRPERPLRASTLPGTVGDHLQPPLIRLDPELSSNEGQALLAELDGLGNTSGPLSPAAAGLFTRLWPDVELALRASRAEHADPGPGLRIVWLSPSPLGDRGLGVFWGVVRLASYEILASFRQDPDRALQLCVDGVGLARDLQIQSSMHAVSMARSALNRLLEPCARAIDVASARATRAAAEELAHIATSAPDIGRMVESDLLGLAFISLGDGLDDTHRQQLSSDALGFLDSAGKDWQPGLLQRLASRDALQDVLLVREQLQQAYSLEAGSAARETTIAAVRERSLRAWNPIAFIGTPSYRHYERRAAVMRAMIVLLSEVASVDVQPGRALPTHGQLDEEWLYLERDGDELVARVVMPLEKPGPPAEWVVRLRPGKGDDDHDG